MSIVIISEKKIKSVFICNRFRFRFFKSMEIGASGVTTVVAAALVEEEQNTGTDRVITQVQGMVGILAMDHHLNKNLAIQSVVQVKKHS